MKITTIFVDKLYAVQYPDQPTDEFDRVFEEWQDPEYLEEFFTINEADLKSGFFGKISIEKAIFQTKYGATKLERLFLEIAGDEGSSFDDIFQPLSKNQPAGYFEKNKAKGKNYKSWLRIYAIKIARGMYCVTGGAIKLTASMEERAHTKIELGKLQRCLDFLTEQSIIDVEGFTELVNE